ncbi:MAG: hypothetical protein VX764_00035 [Planctomycetota bacterium]|nr:hypothetical protein [Planctomycetota bacterium]
MFMFEPCVGRFQPASCRSKCFSLMMTSVVLLILCPAGVSYSQDIYFDDFEGYNAGSLLNGQGPWASWDQIPSWSGTVVDTNNATPGGTNSLQLGVDSSSGIGHDMVRMFNGLNQGQVTLRASVYQPTPVPGVSDGQVNLILLNKYSHEGPKNWSAQILMDDTAFGTGVVVDIGGTAGITGSRVFVQPVFDQWVEVRVEVDLANNTYDAYYDNQLIMDDNIWAGPGGELQVAALDLWNNGFQPIAGEYYWDDVAVEIPGGCGDCCPFDVLTTVSDCSTNSVTLSWTTFQSGGYVNGITVLRDGVAIADLAGDATEYIDLAVDPGIHEYQLVGNCLAATSTWSINRGVMHCDNIDNDFCTGAIAIDLGTSTDFDTTHAVYDSSAPTTCGNGPFNPAPDAWYIFTPGCDGTFEVDTCGTLHDTQIEVLDGGITGDCSALVPVNGTASPSCSDNNVCGHADSLTFQGFAGNNYLVRVSGFAYDAGPGSLNLNLAPVADLSAAYDCALEQVELTWNAAGPVYDSYEVRENGVSIASGVAGTNYTVLNPSPGNNLYEVIGSSGGCGLTSNIASAATSVPIASSLLVTDLIIRAEGPSGLVDSGGALQTALQSLGLDTLLIDGLPSFAPPCVLDTSVSSVQRVWYIGGTFPEGTILSPEEQQILVAAQSAGIHLYFESSDQWIAGIDPSFAAIDGVADGALDGDGSFVSMNGADSGYGLDTSDFVGVAYTQDQGGADSTDRIDPSATDALGSETAVIWSDAGNTYNTGIYYNTNSGGKVLCQTWEFGGFNGDLNDLAGRYVTALGGGPLQPQFRRGDTNQDGSFNIADQVFQLAALFSGGAPCDCPDSCDQNDDGSLNIADPIYGLAALFSGGPSPETPGPTSCGEDPSDDGLTVCEYEPGC